jgi:hypothetical protein
MAARKRQRLRRTRLSGARHLAMARTMAPGAAMAVNGHISSAMRGVTSAIES